MVIDHTKKPENMICSASQGKGNKFVQNGKNSAVTTHISQGKDGISSDFCSFPFAICLNQNIFYITPIKCSSLYFELILKYLATYGLFEGGNPEYVSGQISEWRQLPEEETSKHRKCSKKLIHPKFWWRNVLKKERVGFEKAWPYLIIFQFSLLELFTR